MRRIRASVALAGSLALVGCSPAPSETAPPAASISTTAAAGTTSAAGPGTYVFDAGDGGAVTYTLYAPQDATYLSDVEALRNAAGVAPVTYVSVAVDNTNGAAELTSPDISVASSDGSTTTFTDAARQVGDWYLDAPTDAAYYNQGVEIYNTLLGTGTALPGATSETLYLASTAPADISRVFAEDALGEPVELVKLDG